MSQLPDCPDSLFAAMRAHGERPALREDGRELDFRETLREVAVRAERLRSVGCRRVAIALDNGIDWALWDLAALHAGVVCVPLPAFFSTAQLAHVLDSAGIDTLIADHSSAFHAAGFGASQDQLAQRLVEQPPQLPAGTVKITYTSGSTGQPKGVCLDAGTQFAVARSLWQASLTSLVARHLCVLPLATLLENIAGLYAPLLAGARVELLPMADIGLGGATRFDVERFIATLVRTEPHSVILLPQLLLMLVTAAERGAPLPQSLRFIAVGGGRVSPALLRRADALGLPVFEGYGLSECGSVVCLNTSTERRIGTVGRPLPHAEVRIAPDGEVLVRGPRMLGYLGEGECSDEWLPTGDLGHFDDGFLVLHGRSKHQFITAYGRNVNPEWVEAELVQQLPIAQAWLHGEALPANVAVLVPRRSDVPDAALAEAVAAVNRELPDYAQVHHWLRADEPFTPANGLATANGRLRRAALLETYRDAVETGSAAATLSGER
ncbi:MAG: AMP-binding protein [Aromatoleum sp.]|jgi:long-subunit acyl-CoA synthetase (AMP-forming)|uniref:AMP-binding protein n=1 Tax=Aromatoleum sp. TaxID=2307007 RepID=UPI002894E926|nr:AMP-binding protein [Aromatoleum sp.]MDT3672214.1 AMP-binding protein [Aromatoleum sp.]